MVLSVYTQFAQIARIITFQVEKKQKWFWSDRPERVASKESSSGFANAKNARTDTEIETQCKGDGILNATPKIIPMNTKFIANSIEK